MQSLHWIHLLRHLSHTLSHHGGWKHRLLVVGELWSIRVLLSIGVGDGLVERASHRDVVG